MGAFPYPYERWPRVRRSDALRLRQLLRGMPRLDHGALLAEAATLLGTRASLRADGAPLWLPAGFAEYGGGPPAFALELSLSAGGREVPVLCSMPSELAALLVDRVLGGDGLPAHPLGAPLDELAQGVLAYLAARVLAAAGGALRVQGVLQDPARAGALVGSGALLVLPLTLELSERPAGALWLFADAGALATVSAPQRAPRRLPEPLRALPIQLCAHAGRASLTRRELAALALGDVVVPDHCRLGRTAEGFAGEIELHLIGGRRARFRCSARGQHITIDTVEHEPRSTMSEAKRIQTQAIEPRLDPDPVQLAGDAPVELCLELARFSLPLEELSALRPGEVLITGRAIGQQVALSAAGRTVARGELCEVDGEIGVRILQLG